VPEERIALMRSADVRYVGEGHEVPVPIPAGLSGADAAAELWRAFHRVHELTFGFEYEGEQDVELVNLRVQAIGQVHRPSVARKDGAGKKAKPAETRPVYWRGVGWADCPIYRRDALPAGQTLRGPLIVEEYGSTVVVPKSWRIEADAHGSLKLEKES
jgi:N-methylhydantoinase A